MTDPRTAVVEHYRRRSEGLYRLMTEGFIDGEQDVCVCVDCVGPLAKAIGNAHARIGRAMEAEVFDGREPGEDAA